MQAGITLIIGGLALLSPEQLFSRQQWLLLGLLLLVNLAAATQDIATDGLTVRLLPERWRGLGNSLQVGGYKIGMIISGSGLLLAIDALGWNLSLGIVAVLLLILTLPVWRFREVPANSTKFNPKIDKFVYYILSCCFAWFFLYHIVLLNI